MEGSIVARMIIETHIDDQRDCVTARSVILSSNLAYVSLEKKKKEKEGRKKQSSTTRARSELGP
jgi:hypothetical protein